MNDKNKTTEMIPDEFATYDEAAKFWDTHDTTDYLDIFETIDVETNFRGRYYEIGLEEEVILVLHAKAKEMGISPSRLANNLLKVQLLAGT